MTRPLLSTQVNACLTLTLTVVTQADGGNRLDFAHLANLTPILFWLLTAIEQCDRLTTRAARCAARLAFTAEETYCTVIEWLAEPVTLPWSKTWLKTWSKTLNLSFWADKG